MKKPNKELPVKFITTIKKIQKFKKNSGECYYCLIGETDGVDIHLIADNRVMDFFRIKEGHKYEITGMGYSCVGRMKLSRARLRVNIERAIEVIGKRYDNATNGNI